MKINIIKLICIYFTTTSLPIHLVSAASVVESRNLDSSYSRKLVMDEDGPYWIETRRTKATVVQVPKVVVQVPKVRVRVSLRTEKANLNSIIYLIILFVMFIISFKIGFMLLIYFKIACMLLQFI
jgi:hypothetical protein